MSSVKTQIPTATEEKTKPMILSSCLSTDIHYPDSSTRLIRIIYTGISTDLFRGRPLRPVSNTGKINMIGGLNSNTFRPNTYAIVTNLYGPKKQRS